MRPMKARGEHKTANAVVPTESARGQATRTKRRITRTAWAVRLGLVAALCGTGFLAWHQQWPARAGDWISTRVDDGIRASGLTVESITIRGRKATSPGDLLTAIGVAQGDNILSVNLDRAQASVEALGWVKTARVSRMLPDRLHIEVTERVPYRRWQLSGQTRLIDREGEVILSSAGKEYAHLPRVVGPNANRRATEIETILDLSPRLKGQVMTATLIRNRRWDVGLKGGLVVRLPEQGPAAAWLRFAEYNEHENLLKAKLQVIDMRVPGQVHVRMPGGRVRRVKDRGT